MLKRMIAISENPYPITNVDSKCLESAQVS